MIDQVVMLIATMNYCCQKFVLAPVMIFSVVPQIITWMTCGLCLYCWYTADDDASLQIRVGGLTDQK